MHLVINPGTNTLNRYNMCSTHTVSINDFEKIITSWRFTCIEIVTFRRFSIIDKCWSLNTNKAQVIYWTFFWWMLNIKKWMVVLQTVTCLLLTSQPNLVTTVKLLLFDIWTRRWCRSNIISCLRNYFNGVAKIWPKWNGFTIVYQRCKIKQLLQKKGV